MFHWNFFYMHVLLYYYTSKWSFYTTRHLIGLESYMTKQTKHRVSLEINIMSHLFGNLGIFHSNGIKSQYEHMMLTNMIKSKLFNHLILFMPQKPILLHLIQIYERKEAIRKKLQTITTLLQVENLLEFNIYCVIICCSV